MANKMSTFLNLALVLSLVLIISTIAESIPFFGASPSLICESVLGVQSGDTCFSIALANNLTTDYFDSINPNLNCTALFIGQWLCVDGSSS